MVIKVEGRLLQYVAAISASILTGSVGMGLMWSSTVLPDLYSDTSPIGVKVSEDEGSWIASLLLIGSAFGNVVLGVQIDCFGRRGALLVATIPICISWMLIFFAKSVAVLYVARFVLGFFLAVPVAIGVVYVGEISEPDIRGRLSMICMLMIEVGSVLTVVIGSYCSFKTLALTSAIVPIIFFMTFYSMPESPYYYLRKRNVRGAELSLKRLRTSESIDEELNAIQKSIDDSELNNNKNIFELFTNALYRKPLLIILGLKLLQQLSGVVAIQFYMKIIFEKASTGFDPNISSILCVSVPIPIIFGASYIVDTFGRKPLYYTSTLGLTVSMIFESIYFFLLEKNVDLVEDLTWLPFSGIFLTYIFKSLGISVLSYLFIGELFPVRIKGNATSICLLFGSILASLVSYYFPIFSNTFGMGITFLVFACCCFGGFLFVRFLLPETKGEKLTDICLKMKKEQSINKPSC